MFTRPGNQQYNPPPAQVNDTKGVDPGVHSLTDLLNVSTVNLVVPVLKLWVDYSTGALQSSTLMGDANGQQPADFNPATPKSWYTAGS